MRAPAFQLNAFEPDAKPPPDTELTALIALAGSRNALYQQLWDEWRESDDKERTADRLTSHLSRDYLPVLRELRSYDTAILQREMDALDTRLQKGWAMDDSDEGVWRTYVKLLHRYQALGDAITGFTMETAFARMGVRE